MNKIFMGALIVSSLVTAGDLEKCSHAIDMQKKYSDMYYQHDQIKDGIKDDNKVAKTFYNHLTNFYSELNVLWQEKAREDCKGILEEQSYIYATTGHFKQK